VSIVNGEVVPPFPYAWADKMNVEILLKLIRRRILLWNGWLAIIKVCRKRIPALVIALGPHPMS
jgi:hypothetical protein